jgi:hypothetical protein
MAQDRLFYGAIDNATIYKNGDNSFIRVRFDADATSTTLSNITIITIFINGSIIYCSVK